MNPIIIYCSKTGNTEKVAQSVARGLDGKAEMVKLELSTEGILKEFSPQFTLDVSSYDLVFFGGWVMVMRSILFSILTSSGVGTLRVKRLPVFCREVQAFPVSMPMTILRP